MRYGGRPNIRSTAGTGMGAGEGGVHFLAETLPQTLVGDALPYLTGGPCPPFRE